MIPGLITALILVILFVAFYDGDDDENLYV